MSEGKSPAGEYIRVVDGHLETRQKLSAGTPSASGKSKVFVSTGGFQPTEDGKFRLNLTLIGNK